jgi:hypothetical protein
MSEPVTCPLCGKPALKTEMVFHGGFAELISCPCAPKGGVLIEQKLVPAWLPPVESDSPEG